MIKAIKESGVHDPELNEIIFDPKKTFLRIPQLGFKTEFLPHIPGVISYSECRKNATQTKLDGVEVYILGYDDLIRNKEAVGRDVDRIDVKELKKRGKKTEEKFIKLITLQSPPPKIFSAPSSKTRYTPHSHDPTRGNRFVYSSKPDLSCPAYQCAQQPG